jgi:hypothetical protein
MIAFYVLAYCVVAEAAEKSPLLDAGGNTSLPWTVQDKKDYRWDIQANGTVGDGNNDCYDGGLQLSVQGSGFGGHSQAVLSKDGKEIQLGPWNWSNKVQVCRRIYVDKQGSYARWVDVFHNTSGQEQNLKIRYYSNLGSSIRKFRTAGGKDSPEPDWAFVTADRGNTKTPAIVHVVGTPSAKLRATIKADGGQDNVYVTFRLKIPAGEYAALLNIQMQRPGFDEAVKAMEAFDVHRALRKLPRAARKALANAATPTLAIGGLELPRDGEQDVVLLKDDTELLGTINNKVWTIETPHGTLELPAARVVGLETVGMGDRHVRLALIDGQILAGTLTSEPLKITLANGNTLSTPLWQVLRAGYRISDARPKQIEPDQPVVMLRTGEQLFFDPADFDGQLLTEYGTVTLRPADLRGIMLQTSEGGLHRAVFANGSSLSGLLLADTLETQLPLGPTLSARRATIRKFAFPAEKPGGEKVAVMTLRNENVLRGAVVSETIRLLSNRDEISIEPGDIKELTRAEGALRTVIVKLHSGATVSGDVVDDTIRFAIQPGPQLDVFIGHVNKLTCPKREKPAVEATPEEEPESNDSNSEKSDDASERDRRKEAAKKLDMIGVELKMFAEEEPAALPVPG